MTGGRMDEFEARGALVAAGYRCRWKGYYLVAEGRDRVLRLACRGGTVDAGAVAAALAA
jgi:hypothetical protein